MPFVLDASTALAWCFEDEATAETEAILDRLSEDHGLVPSLWELEVANVLLVGERRGRITEAQSTRFVTLLASLPISVEVASADITTVISAARQHGLTSYDAAYLALAERDGLPLATLDGKLRAAASAAGVELLLGGRQSTS